MLELWKLFRSWPYSPILAAAAEDTTLTHSTWYKLLPKTRTKKKNNTTTLVVLFCFFSDFLFCLVFFHSSSSVEQSMEGGKFSSPQAVTSTTPLYGDKRNFHKKQMKKGGLKAVATNQESRMKTADGLKKKTTLSSFFRERRTRRCQPKPTTEYQFINPPFSFIKAQKQLQSKFDKF